MISLDDSRWRAYRSGYNMAPYDGPGLVRHLQQSGITPWFTDQLWEELHHQGDVGEASYAVIPYIVEHFRRVPKIDSSVVAFIFTVEQCRSAPKNPKVPAEFEGSYLEAIADLPKVALSKPANTWDEDLVRYIAALIALTHGQPVLAEAYPDFMADEAGKWLDEYFGGTRS